MSQSRDQKNIGKLVARTEDGEFVFCDYIFRDELHGNPFNGAVGSIMRPVPRSEYDERIDPENLREEARGFWQEKVTHGGFEGSLDEFLEEAEDDLIDAAYDDSYADEYGPQLRALGFSEADYPVIECTGGGRVFRADDTYAEVYDSALLAEILEVEGSNASRV